MHDQDAHYYRERLAEERQRVLEARTAEAGAAHRALADLYQQRLDEIGRVVGRRQTGPAPDIAPAAPDARSSQAWN